MTQPRSRQSGTSGSVKDKQQPEASARNAGTNECSGASRPARKRVRKLVEVQVLDELELLGSGIQVKTIELARRCCAMVAPPPKLTVSQWADERRILPKSSAAPGRWRTPLTPYLQEPMDACSDPSIHKVVLIFASQTGKSEGLNNIAGFHIDYDPANILMIQPTVEMAQAYSKDRIRPMIEDSPSLSGKIASPRSRDSDNTILRKEFPGGSLTIIGANAPSPLASRFIRIVLADEIDRFPISAGSEGDPLKLAEVRQTTFWNYLTVVTSTPTVKGASRIEVEYENSTQEEWHVPCPSCGELQPYEWGRLQFESAEMCCRHCGVLHGEREWKAQPGRWVAQSEHADTRGFRLNAMASPWLTWPRLIAEFKEAKAKGPEVFKTFVNTRLAECWEEAGETIDENALAGRRHYYDADVPDGATFLTCGVDVHPDRIEAKVKGWGWGKENWGIEYRVFLGDPHLTGVWNELDEFLQQTYRRADGEMLPILGTAIDSGYAATEVYKFCRSRGPRFIYAIKGQGGPGHPIVNKPRKVGKPGADCWLFPVGSDAAKDLVYTRLSVEEEGPGYCHFPLEDTFSDGRSRGFDEAFFKGLLSEHRVERKSQGNSYFTWRKKTSHARNEPLDCSAYATAALEIRGRGAKLEQRRPSRSAQGTDTSKQAAATSQTPAPRKSGRWKVLSRGGGV